ncbi:MAG: hypothetical protein HRT53_11765 [Colwellia sp.]|nr:hypothetical protein [Colwellia sp.]
MEHQLNTGKSVNEVKSSLDDLQNVIGGDNCSADSLIRLTRALKDINEEVNMLRTVIQIQTQP